LTIFNILGQKIKKIQFGPQMAQRIVWNANNELGHTVGSGYYIAQVSLLDKRGKKHSQVTKILYLK